MAMVGAAPASTSTLTRIDVPSAAGDWSITLPTKMLPASLSVVEPSAAAGNAIRRTSEDGSSRLPGARPGASLRPTIARPSAGMASSTTAVEGNHRSFDEVERSSLAHKIGKPVSQEQPAAASRRAA